MAERFVRDLVLVLGIIVIAAVLINIDHAVLEPVKEYLSFVVSTDFSWQPVLNKIAFLQPLAQWDLESWLNSWPQISTGR
ncbi:MAG: hypothetical protein GX101_08340 [Firmicutes bacterium]|jgi:hypothetical protein|nr:hypothetical protein [Bacillota bacterium]NLO66675.1 hypothetical protein [Bacillota bacterium]